MDLNIEKKDTQECTLYKKRWLILFLYFLYTVCCIMHWIEYSAIADVIVEYYKVSYKAVDWSSMVYLLIYIPCNFPATYLINKYGLRSSILIGITGTCIGGWIKVTSTDPSRYWVLMLGQIVVGVSQVLVLPVPPKLAAVWFGAKEVSLACSIAVVSIQLGVAIGFLIPPLIVRQGSTEEIGTGLSILSYIYAIAPTIMLPVLYFGFDNKPPTPPSLAQLQKEDNLNNSSGNLIQSVKAVAINKSYVLLFFYYGISDGLSYAISILLNQIVLNQYPTATKDVGIIGMVMLFAGMLGSITTGVLLSSFSIIKEIVWGISFIYLVTAILLCFVIDAGIIAIYIIASLVGFSANAILNVGFDLGVELTYPISEATSGGLLTTSSQMFGILITYSYSYLLNEINIFWANISLCILLIFADSLLFFIKYDFKRQAVQQNANSK